MQMKVVVVIVVEVVFYVDYDVFGVGCFEVDMVLECVSVEVVFSGVVVFGKVSVGVRVGVQSLVVIDVIVCIQMCIVVDCYVVIVSGKVDCFGLVCYFQYCCCCCCMNG